MDTRKLIKELKLIEADIEWCTGYFACPGITKGLRIYAMQTCFNCAARIRLLRIIRKLEKDKGKN